MTRVSAAFKLKAVKEALGSKTSLKEVCLKYKISRQTLYFWIRKYTNSRLKDLSSLKNSYKKGKFHHKSIGWKAEKLILDAVIKNPKLSVYGLQKRLEIAGLKLSVHGIYNVLVRYNLQRRQLRERFSVEHPVKTVFATALAPAHRAKIVEENIKEGKAIAKVCRVWGVSRPTFYAWLRRYHSAIEGEASDSDLVEALARNYKKAYEHHRSIDQKTKEAILDIVGNNPELSVHKVHATLPVVGGVPVAGHHAVQNLLEREGLNTLFKRQKFAQQYLPEPKAAVAPLYETPIPKLSLWRLLFAPYATIPKWVIKHPMTWPVIFPVTVLLLWIVEFDKLLKPTMLFPTVALSFGIVFFLYSLKYYVSLILVMRLTQSGTNRQNTSANAQLLNFQDEISNSRQSWFYKITKKIKIRSQQISKVDPLLMNLEKVKLTAQPFVSIHVAVYNEKRVIERLIEACCKQNWQNYEVILADDSTDGTTEIVKQFMKENYGELRVSKDDQGTEIYRADANHNLPSLTLIHRSSRSGFKGAALQKALENTNPYADYIAIFDSDFVPYPDTIEQFIKSFQETCGGLDKVKESNIAAIQGYQWHVLNKSQNWVTRGVRTEYAGSYVVERAGIGIYGGLNMIAGSVFCLRADIMRQFGWGKSITEDLELTLRLYEKGYKVVFTPYIQAPAEAVSTIKRLIRQRMRWAEGHTFNIRKMWRRIFESPYLTDREKFEFLYLAPYYLQAAIFIAGTFAWFISEAILHVRLPFWTAAWGWSLIFVNFLSLPLMNLVGLFLEESEERDYLGIASFIVLSYLLVPFQAYAAVKALVSDREGPWFRTPKTGTVTDVFDRMRIYAWFEKLKIWQRPATSAGVAGNINIDTGQLGFFRQAPEANSLALVPNISSFNAFSGYKLRPKRLRFVARGVLAVLLISVMSLNFLAFFVPETHADGTTPALEQQINIIDQKITSGGINTGIVCLTTGNYSGTVTYTFEVVAKVTSGTGTAVLTYDAGACSGAPSGGTTVTISTITATSFTRYTTSFSPSTGNAYVSSLTGTGTTVNAARVVITQTDATMLTITETQVEVGASTTVPLLSYAALTTAPYYCYDVTQTGTTCDTGASPSRFSPAPTVAAGGGTYFEASLVNSNSAGTSKAALYQCTSSTTCTTGTVVSGSEVTVTGTTWTRQRSGAITLTAGKTYAVWITATSYLGTIANAKIILVQSDATNGISSLETIQMYANAYQQALSSYANTGHPNSFDSTKFSGTVTYYNESTIYVNDTKSPTGTGKSRISDGTQNLGEVTTTSTTHNRIRSGSISPTTAVFDSQIACTSCSGRELIIANEWLIIQIQSMPVPEVAIFALPAMLFLPRIVSWLKKRSKGKEKKGGWGKPNSGNLAPAYANSQEYLNRPLKFRLTGFKQ